MKTKFTYAFIMLAMLSTKQQVAAQGTAFTYQGRLNNGSSFASGTYDLRFAIYDSANSPGILIASPLTNSATSVSNGLFTVTLDFGGNVFTGPDRWLDIGVRTNGNGLFSTLNPRQEVTATPYAISAGALPGLAVQQNVSGAPNLIGGSSVNFVSGGVVGATIGGGGAINYEESSHSNSVGADFGTVSGGLDNHASGFASTINGGYFNSASANFGTIGGGQGNLAGGQHTTVGGGLDNTGNGPYATVSGGSFNTSSGPDSTVSGGDANSVSSTYATVGGGIANVIQINSDASAISGGGFNTIATNAPFSYIACGSSNNIQSGAMVCNIGGGLGNSVGGIITNTTISGTVIGGGTGNRADCAYSFIGGGQNNTVNDYLYPFIFSTILTTSPYAVIAGGELNNVGTSGNAPTYPADHSAIGGGYANAIQSASQSVISGGGNNLIYFGNWSAIPGGQNNEAYGYYSFAAGQRAKAYNNGAFVWADSQSADFASTTNDQFNIRAQNGVRLNEDTSLYFGTTTRQMLNLWGTKYGIGVQSLTTYFRTDNADPNNGFIWYKGGTNNSAYANAGGGVELMHLVQSGLYVNSTFVSSSDRNVKQDFADVNIRAILEKVTQLPIQTWAYTNDPATKHLGPVAQDFYAAFNIGPDDKHITTVDEGGVALAAIQGLNQKLNDKDDEIQTLKRQNESLVGRMNKLESMLDQLTAQK